VKKIIILHYYRYYAFKKVHDIANNCIKMDKITKNCKKLYKVVYKKCKIVYIYTMEQEEDRYKAVYTAIANNIRLLRKNLGLTQEQVGMMIGKTRSYIVNIENNRVEVPVYVLYQLADVFECKVYDLLPSSYKDLEAPPIESEIPVSALENVAVLNALEEVHNEVSKG